MSIRKPSDSFEVLLYVAEKPEQYLGRKSIRLFQAFESGYQIGVPAGVEYRWLDKPGFEEFVRQKFPIPERWPQHLNTDSFIDLLGTDDAGAFDLYVELSREYFSTHAPKSSVLTKSANEETDPQKLAILLESVCKHPSMHFGNSDHMESLVAFLNGCAEAEHLHTGASPTGAMVESFQAWLNARHPWALERPWHRILRFQNLWHESWAITAFWTYFDMFRKGAEPEALTPIGQGLLDGANLDNLSESERRERKKLFNRIFYTK